MYSLPNPTRVRINNKGSVEEGVKNAIEGMMEEPVADTCFVDLSGLGVVHFEGFVDAMSILSGRQVMVKRKEIVHELERECLHILFLSLAFHEFLPGHEEIVKRDDILITNLSLFFSMNTPPRSSPLVAETQDCLSIVAQHGCTYSKTSSLHIWREDGQTFS